jgi:hypothetical protein
MYLKMTPTPVAEKSHSTEGYKDSLELTGRLE